MAKDILAASSTDGFLHIEDLAAVLPLMVSCQMDPTCSLDTTVQVEKPPAKKASEVKLWMALVATFSLLVIPILAMALPIAVYNAVTGRTMTIVASLGNCLCGGIIFSLGIMRESFPMLTDCCIQAPVVFLALLITNCILNPHLLLTALENRHHPRYPRGPLQGVKLLTSKITSFCQFWPLNSIPCFLLQRHTARA